MVDMGVREEVCDINFGESSSRHVDNYFRLLGRSFGINGMPMMVRLAMRIRAAARYALRHLCVSAGVAVLIALLVFLVWYPSPYDLLSGGRKLFLTLALADVVCGPLLTLVLVNPQKSRRALWIDMSMVVAIQAGALAYGMHTSHVARPLFLVHEIDRFRVITQSDYRGINVHGAFNGLDPSLRPHWLKGPIVVGIRDPKDDAERQMVLFEAAAGGRDYSQRPEFYVPYDLAYQSKALARARPLADFVAHYPTTRNEAARILGKYEIAMEDAFFLPVQHKQEWVAMLDKSARILGFLYGDGFGV